MGEIAEMMQDGTLCARCGVFLEENFKFKGNGRKRKIVSEPPGKPCFCKDCAKEERQLQMRR